MGEATMEVPRPELLYDHPRSFVNMAASSRAGGMLLFDVYDLCKKGKEEIGKSLQREGIIGDFKDYDCPNSCDGGKLRLVRDASYSKDEYVWKCTNRKCNKKVSVRKGSWFEGSHMTLEQMILFTYMWVWLCEQQFIMRECRIGSCSTIVDWCNFAREVCATI